MSLTALEMKRLDDDARAMASSQCRGYLADALQCLRDSDDAIAPLELLRAMWGTAHARRPEQKASLQDVGHWLEDRLRRDPLLALQRLQLELGWLHRLASIHRVSSDGDRDTWAPPREPPFGAHTDALRRRREQAFKSMRADDHLMRATRPGRAGPSGPARPEHLPDSFEACFTSWQDAINAFKNARKRRKQQKPPKDLLLAVRPVKPELQALATDIVCSMLNTQGMDELQDRAVEGTGDLPGFSISVADLAAHEGKRLAARIALSHERAEDRALMSSAPDERAKGST